MEQIAIISLVVSAVSLLLLLLIALRLRSAKRTAEAAETESRNLLDGAPFGVITTDRATGEILTANPAATELLGREPTQIEGKKPEDFLAPENGVPTAEGSSRFVRGDGTFTNLMVGRSGGGGKERETILLLKDDERVAAGAALEDLEDRYRGVISTAPALVYTVDLKTGETSCDGAFLPALPGSPELPAHREDAEKLEEFRRSPGGGTVESEGGDAPAENAPPASIEYGLMTEDRRELRLREVARVVPGEDGEPAFLRGVVMDITRVRELGRKLREVRDLNLVLAGAFDGGVVIRRDGRLFGINAAGAEILGSTPEELEGRAYLDFVHPDSERAARAGMRRTDRGDREPESRMVWLRANGYEVEVEVFAAPVGYSGDEVAALLFFRDVTAVERAKRKEVLLSEELKSRNSRLEHFVRSTARDLRSSLSDLDAASKRSPELSENWEVRATAREMFRVLDDLSRLASLPDDEGAESPEAGEVDLSRIARSVSARLEGEDTGARSVEVIVAGGLSVKGESETLTRAMTNLMENAWRAAVKSPRPRVVVGRVERAGKPVFFVRDNGPGFDMAGAGSIFDPTSEDQPGTVYGEGLPAARRIIERHGGQLWAESEPGRGATFYLTL